MRLTSRLVITLAVLAAAAVALAAFLWLRASPPDSPTILLGGTIVTPDTVIADGWVLVEHGRIRQVSAARPDAPNAIEVNTGGLIFPGLIDLHNHVSYDVFSRWQPPHLFSNRYEWRTDPDYLRLVGQPYDQLIGPQKLFCAMNTYGELRALAGGTTSILATAAADCIQGLVRNLDHNSGFYGFLEPDSLHILDEIEMRATTSPATISAVKTFLASRQSEAFLVHLAEGVDAASLDEFFFLQQQGLLTGKTVLIHGLALGPAQFQAMHAAGASLVWSPRSNVALYGQTTDIQSALQAGVRVALAPDWSVTGSSNMLYELHYAAQWNADHLAGSLTDQQLVRMVTALPAQIAGIDDQAGAIQPGLFADLLVISGDRADPYHALIQAQPADVQLVLIGGQPLYGAPGLMASFWKSSDLNALTVDGQPKMVKMPASAANLNDLETKLQSALAAQGASLAPLP